MVPSSKRERSESPSSSASVPPPPPPRQTRSLSILSTDSESSEGWPKLAETAKERISRYQKLGKALEDKLQSFLNAFIDWLPEKGRESIARDIVNATTDENLYKVFHSLLTGLAIPMKVRSSQSSISPSPHENIKDISTILDEPVSRDPKFRDLCLQRDNYCCVISGDMDLGRFKVLGRPDGVMTCMTQVAHIIPFSYGSWNTSTSNQTASAWEILYRYFPYIREIGMQIENINDVSNGITMRDYLHLRFRSFLLAFKPTNTDDVYELKIFPGYPDRETNVFPKDNCVRFTKAKDTQHLELPRRVLLDCHYRLCEILHVSGMAEVIEKYMRDWEDIKGNYDYQGSLREDGRSDIELFLQAGMWERVVG